MGLVVAVLALLNSLALAALVMKNGLAGSRLHEHVEVILSRVERGDNPSQAEYASLLKPVHGYLAETARGKGALLVLAGVGFSILGLLLAMDRLRDHLAAGEPSSRPAEQSGSPGAP